MKRKVPSIALGLLVLLGACPCRAKAPAEATGPAASAGPRGDRWLEIDLYWFDRDNIGRSAEEFWTRYAPLFAGVQGWRGVILNIGWTTSYVLDWRGNLNERIFLPKGMKERNWFKVTGMLTGTTEERKKEWKDRFRDPESHLKRYYQPWTYADVKALAQALRSVASRRGLTDIRVGSLGSGLPDDL